MKPVYQTINNPRGGNCMEACIASMLHMELEDVGTFRKDLNWYDDCDAVLKKYGFQLLSLPYTKEAVRFMKGYYIVGGPSPNFPNIQHAVICKDGKVVHNPSQSGKPFNLDTATGLDLIIYLSEGTSQVSTIFLSEDI